MDSTPSAAGGVATGFIWRTGFRQVEEIIIPAEFSGNEVCSFSSRQLGAFVVLRYSVLRDPGCWGPDLVFLSLEELN